MWLDRTVAFASMITGYGTLISFPNEDTECHSPGAGTQLGTIQHCRSIADEGGVDNLR